MARLDEIRRLLQEVSVPLDDDDIAERLGINRHHVNQICRQLAYEGPTTRSEGPDGKPRNLWRADVTIPEELAGPLLRGAPPRRRTTRLDRSRTNVEALVEGFARFVSRVERSNAFARPSLYFHERAIAVRRGHENVRDLMKDVQFFEYIYAVLPSWGMHRMGKTAGEGWRVRRHDRKLPYRRTRNRAVVGSAHFVLTRPSGRRSRLGAVERPAVIAGEHVGNADRGRLESPSSRS
jgi:hypothetical protein